MRRVASEAADRQATTSSTAAGPRMIVVYVLGTFLGLSLVVGGGWIVWLAPEASVRRAGRAIALVGLVIDLSLIGACNAGLLP